LRRGLAAAALSAACFIVYWPAFGGGFVWDDYQLIAENQALRGLDGERLRWMATSFYHSTYQPLGWLAYALIHAAFGLNPFYFHAAGVALHVLCAVLLLEAARRLFTRAESRRPLALAFAAALLWAVHPLQAATAGWATEIPDQLATAFVLGTLIVYLGRESAYRLPAALGLFALSGLFRWKGVGLPLVLLALDYYPLKRLPSRRVLTEKLAFALVAVAILFANSLAKASSQFEPSAAPGTVARGLLLFLRLVAWPAGLLQSYDLGAGLGSAAAVALVVIIAALFLAGRRRLPAAPAALACLVAGLLPPLLNAKFGLTFAFPHYAYLSTMGLFVAGAAGVDVLARRAGARTAAAAVLCLALVWGGLSRRLVPIWGDELLLWTRATALDEKNPLAQGSLGGALARAGRYNEAYFHFEAAKRLSVGPYRWNQLAQHRNLMLLKSRVPGLKPDPALFELQRAASLRACAICAR
jgi:hypothetical protein